MARHRSKGNFDVFSNHAWYVPGVSGMFILLAWLIAGALIGNIFTLIFSIAGIGGSSMEFGMLVSYPVMFIPPMLYAAFKSRNNSLTKPGLELDSANFSPLKGGVCALLVILATLSASFTTDAINSAMPPMPEWLEDALGSMTGGTLWVDFLLVSIMAPIFEEWLCRGMVLRGLLGNDVKPVWAIIISATFFAVIHANPWQAVPAFLLGCLFGYVYFRTGSLKLTMLMHFTNNTMALVATKVWPEAETWFDIAGKMYWPYFVLALVVLGLTILAFNRVKLKTPRGNCDPVEPLFSE